MLGRSHAILAGTAALALLPLLPNATSGRVAAGAAVAAGAGLLADLDTRASTVSRSLGPVTQALSAAVGAVSGGHRKGTHSVIPLFPALVAGLVWLLVHATPAAALPVVAVTIALALRAAGPHELRRHGVVGVGVAGVAAAFVIELTVGFGGWWLEEAVFAGTWLHVAGDALTAERVPILWPLVQRRIGVPLVARTGNATEVLIVAVVTVIALVLGVRDFDPSLISHTAPALAHAALAPTQGGN